MDICYSPLLPALILLPLFFSACTADGGRLFHEQGCINCHRFQGEGGMMGPDLTAVRQRRSAEWIMNYLPDPRAVNPAARMPAFPQLSKAQRRAIIDFLGGSISSK